MNQWSKISLKDRFWNCVDKKGPVVYPELGPCWSWMGATDGRYGIISAEGVLKAKAHRVAWFLETGAWPTPNALHKCDNTICVRFSHLFEGTHRDNMADKAAKGRCHNKWR
jgi:hypothetical protein